MKKILVPTDFSGIAANAYVYAQHVAQITGGSVHLLHIYHPSLDAVNPYLNLPAAELGEKKIKTIRKFANNNRLEAESAGEVATLTEVTTEIIVGYAGEEIVQASKEYDLVVMGTLGESGLMRSLLGSVSTHVAKKASCPVMLIPPDAVFEGLNNLMFAASYKQDDDSTLEKVLDNLTPLGLRKAHMVHVNRSNMDYTIEDIRFEELSYKNNTEVGVIRSEVCCRDGLMAGLEKYAKDNNIDIIVLTAVNRTLLEDMIHKSLTREMILHAELPLLVEHI